MNDVVIKKRNGGLGRRNPTEDMVSALITMGVAVAGKIALGDAKQLFSENDAKALGIDAAYDAAAGVQVYYHISEYFRVNPDGELWIKIMAQATTYAALVDPDTANGVKHLLAEAGGRVRQLGVAFNPAAGYAPVLAEGLDSAVVAAIAKAQLLCDYQDSINTPLSAVVIDGREFNGTTAAAKDLRGLTSPKVSVFIGRDHKVAANTKGSAIGTILGAISKAKVNENIGWVAKFNVADINLGKFVQAGITNGSAISTLAKSDMDALNTKGYIFLRDIAGISGKYFNDSHTCVAKTDDYAFIENNRTMDKAIRATRTVLLPQVSGPLLVDEETGWMAPETAKALEGDAEGVLEQMKRDKEISGGDAYCDEKQDVLATSQVEVRLDLVPYGTGRTLVASLGFTNPFNQ